MAYLPALELSVQFDVHEGVSLVRKLVLEVDLVLLPSRVESIAQMFSPVVSVHAVAETQYIFTSGLFQDEIVPV